MPHSLGHFFESMANFVLYIQADCFASPVLDEVQRFASAAIALGHQIDHIFFYQQAVQVICPDLDLPSDEIDLVGRFCEFASAANIPLLYCATAAEKRGFTKARPGFTLAGLAEFGMRLSSADKLVQF
jgi:tRNA 2-thiouridine synthesizing protein D